MKATLDHDLNMPATGGQFRTGWTLWRMTSLLLGSVLVLCSLALIVGGGYLLSAATSDAGWLKLGHGTYETDSYAVITEPEDWSTQTYALDNVKKVRVRVVPKDAATPVFVGMAKEGDVKRYLSDIQH